MHVAISGVGFNLGSMIGGFVIVSCSPLGNLLGHNTFTNIQTVL